MTESPQPDLPTTGNSSTLLQLEYLAFDPGKRTGVCGWVDPKQIPVIMEIMEEKERDTFLQRLDPSTLKCVLLEDYRVRNEKFNHQGDRVYTAKVIGDIEGFCRRNQIDVVLLQPTVKKIAAKWVGYQYPRGHLPDHVAAWLIGSYYLRINNLMPSRVLQERGAIE